MEDIQIDPALIAESVKSLVRSYLPIYARKQLRKCKKLLDSNLYGFSEKKFQNTLRQAGEIIDELSHTHSLGQQLEEEISDMDWLIHFIIAEHKYLAGI